VFLKKVLKCGWMGKEYWGICLWVLWGCTRFGTERGCHLCGNGAHSGKSGANVPAVSLASKGCEGQESVAECS